MPSPLELRAALEAAEDEAIASKELPALLRQLSEAHSAVESAKKKLSKAAENENALAHQRRLVVRELLDDGVAVDKIARAAELTRQQINAIAASEVPTAPAAEGPAEAAETPNLWGG